MTLNPQFMLCSCLSVQSDYRHQRAPLTRAQNPQKKQNKKKTWRQTVSFTANTRRVDTHRIFGEMLVDGFVLQVVVIQMVFRHAHSSNMASPHPNCSLQINRRTEPRCAVRKRWWTTRAAAERIGGLLIDITCDWQRGVRGLIDRQWERTRDAAEGRRPRSRGVTTWGGGPPRTDCPTRLTLTLWKAVNHH